MALWNLNGEIVYSDGALSLPNPKSGSWASRYSYTVPYTNIGKGGFIEKEDKKYHVPSWIEVHPQTTLDDIVVEEKPFQELFVEPETWEFKSASSDKMYKVKRNKSGNLSCDCWGYIAHKKCKHIKSVESL